MDVNLIGNVEYVRSQVILNSYSSSKYFVGYCFSESCWDDHNFFDILLDVISLFCEKLQLVSSLNIDLQLDHHANEYELDTKGRDCRDNLIKCGIITNNIGAKPSDYFHFDEYIESSVALDILRYQTTVGGAFGHAFFVDPKQGSILYPHDDCGLGFILADGIMKSGMLNVLYDQESKYKDLMKFKFT